MVGYYLFFSVETIDSITTDNHESTLGTSTNDLENGIWAPRNLYFGQVEGAFGLCGKSIDTGNNTISVSGSNCDHESYVEYELPSNCDQKSCIEDELFSNCDTKGSADDNTNYNCDNSLVEDKYLRLGCLNSISPVVVTMTIHIIHFVLKMISVK